MQEEPEATVELDEIDWLELHGHLAEMRWYLVDTLLWCFAAAGVCESMVALVPLLAVQVIFTALAVVSALLAIVQTAYCSAEVIRLAALLQAWGNPANLATPSVEEGAP
jgi:hypothetical protein